MNPFYRKVFKCSLAIALALTATLEASADVVLTMGGDVNFNRNRLGTHPLGVTYDKNVVPWKSLTHSIRPLINGDLNFANIETVVTDDNSLINEQKAFAFMSHTNSIRHLIEIGFNLFNLANNHTYDYGQTGIEKTLMEFQKLKQDHRNIIYAGVADRPTLLQPEVFSVNGIRIAFAGISIMDPRFSATMDRNGLLNIRSDKDFQSLMAAFKKTQADFKILSTHFGVEGKVTLDPGQKTRYEYALQQGDINLIIGHHPHVARPIQNRAGRFIFYSLGNYLMLGSADITKKQDTYADWGMFARLYLERDPRTGKVKIDAAEVIPLTNTHSRATPMSSNNAAIRIEGLNVLSMQELGADEALDLKIDSLSGKGVFCGDNMTSIRAKTMCASHLNLRR